MNQTHDLVPVTEQHLDLALAQLAFEFSALCLEGFIGGELEALDAETREKLAGLPESRRTVVTAHDAFGYLADAYDLTFLAPVGIDTEAEPSARELADLIAHLKETGAGALFVENISSPALVEQIALETGLKIGGRLFSDALSEKGGPATSYIAMFEHNLGALIAALAPEAE